MRKLTLLAIFLAMPVALSAQYSGNGVPNLTCGANIGNAAYHDSVNGANYTCQLFNGIWQWRVSPSVPGVPPGGSTGQIQYNNSGAFAGASGGTTNGTHWAFGDGSTVDDAPTSFPDGVMLSPKAVQTISEEYTGTDLENGLYLNLLLDPSIPGVATNGAYGLGIEVTSSGDGNWNNASEVDGMVVQDYFNDTGTGQNEGGLMIALEGISLNENSGEIDSSYGDTSGVVNLSDGTIDNAAASHFSIANFTTGAILNAVEIQGAFASNANLTTENDVISALSPVLSGTAAITTAKGLDIQEQAVTGVTTGIGIDQEGTDPNILNGQTTFGDLISPGILTMADGTAHIATAGGDGWQFNCSDCDTPVTEGVACTASGDHAGALAIQLRGALKCF